MNYPPEVILLAKTAKTFGDIDRLKILRYLSHHGDSTLPELQEITRIHPKALKEHLRILMRSKLVHFYQGMHDRLLLSMEKNCKDSIKSLLTFLNPCGTEKTRIRNRDFCVRLILPK